MKKVLVGIGVFLAILWVISFNKGRNLRQVELAADISCATFEAWEKYGMTLDEIEAKNIDIRQAVQDTVLPVIHKHKLSEAAFRTEYLKIQKRMQNDLSFSKRVANLMQKKGCKAPF